MHTSFFKKPLHKGKPLITRLEAAAFLGLVLAVITTQVAVFGRTCDEVRDKMIRLHVFANSDNAVDQNVKLQVRDRILETIDGIFDQPLDLDTALTTVKEQLPAMESAARDVLLENGFDLPVKAELCTMYFNTREYEGITFPAGSYQTVRVTLGAGAGHNWWYVLYPPVRLPAVSQTGMGTPEAMDALAEQEQAPLFKPKLAIVEAFEAIKNKLSGAPK